MNRVSIIVLSGICFILASCKSVQQTIEDATYSVNGPNITYSQHQVKVIYRDYRTAPYKQGQRIYLMSEDYGGAISVAQFKAFKQYPAARTFALIAMLDMPVDVPQKFKDSCFYLANGQNENAAIVAVKPTLKEAGFINETWQANVAKHVQLTLLNGKVQSNSVMERNLITEHALATKYLANSSVYSDNSCSLPINSEPKPVDPFSDFFTNSNLTYIGYAICHTTDYRDIPLEKKGLYYINSSEGKVNRYDANGEKINEAIDELIQFQTRGDARGKIKDYFDYAQLIYNASNRRGEDCTALSSCNIYDELFYGSTNREYPKHFEQCSQMVSSKIRKQKTDYKASLQRWAQAPISIQNKCIAKKQAVESFQDNLNTILRERQLLEVEQDRIRKIEDKTFAANRFRIAKETTCPVGN